VATKTKKNIVVQYVVVFIAGFLLSTFVHLMFFKPEPAANKPVSLQESYLDPHEVTLLESRQQAQKETTSDKAQFVYSVSRWGNEDSYAVQIRLKAPAGTKIDSADLNLNWNVEEMEIENLVTGPAFPSYPRKEVLPGKINLVATAGLEKKEIVFARENSEIASFIVRKKTKAAGFINVENTSNIYFLGNPLLDTNNKLTQMVIK